MAKVVTSKTTKGTPVYELDVDAIFGQEAKERRVSGEEKSFL